LDTSLISFMTPESNITLHSASTFAIRCLLSLYRRCLSSEESHGHPQQTNVIIALPSAAEPAPGHDLPIGQLLWSLLDG
jgi:hypothetical protein